MKIVGASIVLMAVCLTILAPDAAAIEHRIASGEPPATVGVAGQQRRLAAQPRLAEPTPLPEGYAAPAGYVLWVTGPYSAVEVPFAFAVQAVAVAQCESRFNPAAVGHAGEKGILQIHPIHRARMAEAGLDFESEADRLRYAVALWQRSSWSPWSCKP